MKLKYIAFILICCGLFVVSFNPKSTLAKSAGAPQSPTGAPIQFSQKEQTCSSPGCHNDYIVNSGPGSLSVQLMNGGNTYQPGEIVQIKVKASQTGFQKYGFEAVAIREYSQTSKIQAGKIVLNDAIRTQLLEAIGGGNLIGREYITHTFEGNQGSNDSNEWTFLWQADDTLSGDVSIYVSAVSADGDQDVTNDYVYTDTLTLSQSPLGLGNTIKQALKVYPTLVSDYLFISGNEMFNNNNLKFVLYNMNGQIQLSTNSLSEGIDLNHLSAGLYGYSLISNAEIVKVGKIVRK